MGLNINTPSRLSLLMAAVLVVPTTLSSIHSISSNLRNQSPASPNKRHDTPIKHSSPSLSSFHQRSLVEAAEWVQLGDDIDGEDRFDMSGSSVVMSRDGKYLAIGAPGNDGNYNGAGHVRVFKNENSKWKQIGDDIEGRGGNFNSWGLGEDSARIGEKISISGNGLRVAIGAPTYSVYDGDYSDKYDDDWNDNYISGPDLDDYNVGYVSVYDWNGERWERKHQDTGRGEDEMKGLDVSLSDDGNRIAVRCRERVEVYEDNGSSSWDLLASQYIGNGDTTTPVSISGNGQRVAVMNKDPDGLTWIAVYELSGSGLTTMGMSILHVGESVSLSFNGDRVAGGGRWNNIRIYDWNGSSWKKTVKISDNGLHMSMSSDGRRLVVGEPGDDDKIPGSVRVYEIEGSTYEQVGAEITGEATGDRFGDATAISADGEHVAIGAFENDGRNGEGSGHARVFKFEHTPSTDKFPVNFASVTCTYSSCVTKLLKRYKARDSFGDETLEGYAETSEEKVKEAKDFIKGGKVLRSIAKLMQATKDLERLGKKHPGFANGTGRQASTCAIKLVENFILAFQGEGTLDDEFLNNLMTNYAAARVKRTAKQWRKSVVKAKKAILTLMNRLEEKTVPLCFD